MIILLSTFTLGRMYFKKKAIKKVLKGEQKQSFRYVIG